MFRNKPQARYIVAKVLASERHAGASYAEAGGTLGYSASGARRMLKWLDEVERKVQLEILGSTIGWDAGTGIEAECHACGERFYPRRAGTRYCSNACRQDAYRKRKLGLA